MKQLVALALAAGAFAPAFAGVDVGLSIGFHEPGIYGRIDLGGGPPPAPALVYSQPTVIAPSPVATYRRPIYLYVPPGHEQHWDRYCGRWGACGQPVYFVRDRWVRDTWAEHHAGYYGRPVPPGQGWHRNYPPGQGAYVPRDRGPREHPWR